MTHYRVKPAERARREAHERGRALAAFTDILPADPGEAADALPIAVKNNIAVRDVPTRAGFDPTHAAEPARDDATVVARWRAAGGAVIGVTTMDEAALGASGMAIGYGPIGNPAAPGHSPGGSSGGSAAAVTAGIVRIALGTDTMGSVRIPASWCGVVGFKPSRGLLPLDGVTPLAPSFDHVGLIAADVEDVRRALPILAGRGADAGPSRLPEPGESLRGRRFGVPAFLRSTALEPEVSRAFEAACDALVRAGARLVPLDWDTGFSALLRKETFLLVEHEAAVVHADLLDADPSDERASPALRKMLAFGRELSDERIARARAILHDAAERVAIDTRGLDAVITPTTPSRAFRHGAPPPTSQADLTVLANVTGFPAISVPCTRAGSPVGLHLTGCAFEDDAFLRLAEAVRRTTRMC